MEQSKDNEKDNVQRNIDSELSGPLRYLIIFDS